MVSPSLPLFLVLQKADFSTFTLWWSMDSITALHFLLFRIFPSTALPPLSPLAFHIWEGPDWMCFGNAQSLPSVWRSWDLVWPATESTTSQTFSVNPQNHPPLSSFNNNSQAPYQGCLSSITMDSYGFKVLVPATNWDPPCPALTKFSPGHDAHISSNGGNTTVTISFEFNTVMSCTGVTQALSFNLSFSGQGGNPRLSHLRP